MLTVSHRRKLLMGARLFFGSLALAAIGTQLSVHIQDGFNLVNFFSYFTNLSNIFAAVVMITGALYLIKHREPTVTEDIIRGTSVVSMILVGIVFTALLQNEDLGALLPWVNRVVHYVMPVVVLLDWLYQPAKTRLVFSQMLLWLVFPLLYVIYSLIRGSIVDWYAYPFFNPAKVGGYGVALYCAIMLIVFFFVSWLAMTLGNKLNRYKT